jgi:hypothetical protein
MDKDNKYAGKQKSRSVDARVVETQQEWSVAGFAGVHHVREAHFTH